MGTICPEQTAIITSTLSVITNRWSNYTKTYREQPYDPKNRTRETRNVI